MRNKNRACWKCLADHTVESKIELMTKVIGPVTLTLFPSPQILPDLLSSSNVFSIFFKILSRAVSCFMDIYVLARSEREGEDPEVRKRVNRTREVNAWRITRWLKWVPIHGTRISTGERDSCSGGQLPEDVVVTGTITMFKRHSDRYTD